MDPRFRSKRSLGAMAEINITPLLDMAFALLIIFVITTPLLEQPVPVQLPSLSQSEEIVRESPQDPTEITIDNNGTVFLGDEPLRQDELQAILGSLPREQVLIVRGDREVPYGRVAEVLDLIRQSGVQSVVVSYEP
jgi:biopolymer transport protein ExbD